MFLTVIKQFQASVYIKIQSTKLPVSVKAKKVKEAETFLQKQIELYNLKSIDEYSFVKLVLHKYKI